MRVCQIIEAAGGGSARNAVQLMQHLKDAGDHVTLIYAPQRATQAFLNDIAVVKPTKVIALPMERSVGPKDAISAWRLFNILRREGPFDVIHSQSSKAGALARLVGVFYRKPVQVYTPHAFVTMAPGASRLYGVIERILSWFGDHIIAVSKAEATHASRDLGIAATRIGVVPNGITLDHPATRATARAKMGFDENTYVLGFVGRLVAQKNPQRLVNTFALVAAERPDIRLAIVGDGPLQELVEAGFKAKGLTDHIRLFTGYDGRDLMPAFDSLLCTSDYEGFAYVFLEALAAGIPIVTPPVGGAEETVINGATGIVTPDFAPENLANAVLQLAALPPEARAVMAASVRRHAQEFSLDVMGRKTRAVYEAALAKRKRA